MGRFDFDVLDELSSSVGCCTSQLEVRSVDRDTDDELKDFFTMAEVDDWYRHAMVKRLASNTKQMEQWAKSMEQKRRRSIIGKTAINASSRSAASRSRTTTPCSRSATPCRRSPTQCGRSPSPFIRVAPGDECIVPPCRPKPSWAPVT